MITSPLNDHECLESITAIVRDLVTQRDAELLALARQLASPGAAIRWMRSLPQRDDLGQAGDGPRVEACEPPQRLRLPAPDPNCVERAALYLVLGEFLAPDATRQLATIDTPVGRHTLPVENGGPVVLDPRVPRNCAQAGVDTLCARPAPRDVGHCAAWVCAVAAEPAQQLPGGPRRLRNAQAALAATADGVPLHPSVADDVAMVLALAAREARRWGAAGLGIVERVTQTVLELQRTVARYGHDMALAAPERLTAPPVRNAVELRLGKRRLRPAVPEALGAALRALGVIGLDTGAAVARAKLATLGVTPGMLGVLEHELNRDGLSLGALARPAPPVHAFGALTTDALVARHLERAGAA